MSDFVNWFSAHQALIGGSMVAVLDLIFALKSSWASNGILHFILVQAQKLAGKTPS